MNGWITRVPVAVGAMLLLAAAGCGDAPGVDGHSCSYTCPGSEVVHPASQKYNVSSNEAAVQACEADHNTNACDTPVFICGCS